MLLIRRFHRGSLSTQRLHELEFLELGRKGSWAGRREGEARRDGETGGLAAQRRGAGVGHGGPALEVSEGGARAGHERRSARRRRVLRTRALLSTMKRMRGSENGEKDEQRQSWRGVGPLNGLLLGNEMGLEAVAQKGQRDGLGDEAVQASGLDTLGGRVKME